MSKTLRTRKDGSRVYEIRVSRGRDPNTGKQLTPYSMTWKIPENYSDKKAEREAGKIEGEFIAKCKAGKVLTKQEKKQREQEQAKQREIERLEQASKPTFEEYMEMDLKRLEKTGYAVGTIQTYQCTFNRANTVLGKLKMEDITKDIVRQYFSDMQTESNLKYSSQVRHFSILKSLFAAAVEDGTIQYSPMADLKRPRKPKDEKGADNMQDKAYDEKQVTYIMECLNHEPLKWKALVIYMLDTGCRRGEVAGIKWENINLDTGEVTVCNNRQYTSGKGVYDTTPKSGKTRTVFLTEPALKIMKAWHKEQIRESFKKGIPCSAYCFNASRSEALNPTYISRYFKEFGKKYDIPHFHPHALRHTMATISIANGADVVSVSKKLGHSNTSITLDVYSHANEEAQKRANDVLANAIYGSENRKQA
ncbi:MAG: tyrosine-type recombinase/integrase [Lachnospiraceae bacterium]|nr:tyrosine-type recombinase/integrase [Lachnospiraceae bacterium]